MSVLSRQEIVDRLKKPIDHRQSLRISPLFVRTCDELLEELDHDAVDVRLGWYFRLPAISTVECIKPYQDSDALEHYPKLVHRPYLRIPQGDTVKTHQANAGDSRAKGLVIQPHHAVLASTLEYIKMPEDVSAEILTKSSWARIFISIASAPWVHPLFRGCLTLEITNLGNVPVLLPVGEKIAHLVFMHLGDHEVIKEDLIEGPYAGAVMPEVPIFRR